MRKIVMAGLGSDLIAMQLEAMEINPKIHEHIQSVAQKYGLTLKFLSCLK